MTQNLPTDRVSFCDALDRAWTARARIAASLTDYRDPASLPADAQWYLSDDGASGFIVRADGEIVGLFSTARGRGDTLVSEAIAYGGTHLDCFEGYLSALYARHGFKVYRREANWTAGAPDVVFMQLDVNHLPTTTTTREARTMRTPERREFLADIITTALEGGVGYWSQASEYRWFSPTLSGGTATPGPNGTANAYATLHETDTDDGELGEALTVDVDVIAKAFGLIALSASGKLEIPSLSHDYARRLMSAYREIEAGDIDAGDADNIVQVGLFGEVRYG